MPPSASPFDVVRDANGDVRLDVRIHGDALLRSGLTNKGTAFTASERAELGLEGLLPPRIESLDEQRARARAMFDLETSELGKYRFLRRLQDQSEVLFYALLLSDLHEMLPLVYTPTVAEGVRQYSRLFERPRGLQLSCERPDDIETAILACPLHDVRMIVATDSSAILGIGDQGYNGLAISIGKLSLYTAAGAVSPFHTLPVVLDVGTDRQELLDDPHYLGVRRSRCRGDEHRQFVGRFVAAVQKRWPKAILQWEDFGKDTAFSILDAFRQAAPSFNDDIQGTGAVALAGLVSAARQKKARLADERFLVYGAGAGGVGVARAIRSGLEREGLSRAQALRQIFVVDSKGLLVEGRSMEDYKREFAQPAEVARAFATPGGVPSFLETIRGAKITALLGLSGQPRSFGEEVVRAVGANSARPIVFALSNPTHSCEATPADVLLWTEGRAIVATGSPFEPVVQGGKTFVIGQGNNAFVFPGIGFGALIADARAVTDGMIEESAYALAEFTRERHASSDVIYPPIEDLREVSIRVAARVAKRAVAEGVATRSDLPEDLEGLARRLAWSPSYLPFRRA